MYRTSGEPGERPKLAWGVPASVSVHVVVLALLIFGLPLPHREPDETAAIDVELTPPPEASKPEPSRAKEKQAEPPPAQKSAATAKPDEQPPPVANLRPVFHFGRKDGGPRRSDDGKSAIPAKTAPAPPPRELVLKPDARDPDTEEHDKRTIAVPAPELPIPAPAKPRPVLAPTVTGELIATTAMDKLPRGMRAGELCATELREQLRRSMPPYWPDLLPAYRLDEGTVLQVRKGAFRANARWYDLRFRCEVDADATRVESFAFEVGAPVPQGEWSRRGFPAR